MEQESGYRELLRVTVCHTIVVILYLIILIIYASMDVGRWTRVLFMVAFIFFAVSAVNYWIKGTKKYIDFAIEEKIKQKRESASSPNENVS